MQTITYEQSALLKKRLLWLDLAKSYGMILVFGGHIVESFNELGFASAFPIYKLIYAFHMPLFFLLSGYISKPADRPFFQFLKVKLFTRILPLLFFNVVGFVILCINDWRSGTLSVSEYFNSAYLLLKGVPMFNLSTWFLMCLVSVEIIHFFATKLCRSHFLLIIGSAILFGLGWILTLKYRVLAWNYWFVAAACVAYIFYCIGYTLKQNNGFSSEANCKDLYGFLITAAITLFTFNLNQDFFVLPTTIVYLSLSSYGQPFLFLITALSGSLAVIYLTRWLSAQPQARSLHTRLGLEFIGKHTLIFLGLSGIFLMFINDPLAGAIAPYVPDNQISMIAVCSLITAFSMLLCVPFVLGLSRYLPQLVGLPKIDGPFLSKLMT